MNNPIPKSANNQGSSFPAKRRGKASQQRRQDAFRTKKNEPELARIHEEMRQRTFADLDVTGLLAQLQSLSVSTSKTELQVPATTRGAGLLSQSIFEEAQVVAHRAVENSGITPVQMYRVTLTQVAVQQQLAKTRHSASQDEIVAQHQSETVPADVCEEIVSTRKTFALLGTVPNSFGKYDEDGCEYRTFIPPHPLIVVERPRRVDVGDEPQRVVPAVAQMVRQLVPHPYFITIQTLRAVVEALSPQADPPVPPASREYFRRHNPIPGVIWNDQNQILNPDEICAPNYFTSEMFYNDINTFRRFVSAAGTKMSSLLTEIRLDGYGSNSMFVSLYHPLGNVDYPPRGQLFRASRPLSDQDIILGAIPLIGEVPSEIPPEQIGFGFREPTCSYKSFEFNWKAVINDLLVKQ